MPRFCFNWSLTGSTIVEADNLIEARAKWDKIETNTDILASASAVDFGQDGTMIETSPGNFEEIDREPDPGSDDPDCVHEWAYTGSAYGDA